MIEAKPRSLPGRLSAFSRIYYFDHELYTSVCSTFRFVSQNNFFSFFSEKYTKCISSKHFSLKKGLSFILRLHSNGYKVIDG